MPCNWSHIFTFQMRIMRAHTCSQTLRTLKIHRDKFFFFRRLQIKHVPSFALFSIQFEWWNKTTFALVYMQRSSDSMFERSTDASENWILVKATKYRFFRPHSKISRLLFPSNLDHEKYAEVHVALSTCCNLSVFDSFVERRRHDFVTSTDGSGCATPKEFRQPRISRAVCTQNV